MTPSIDTLPPDDPYAPQPSWAEQNPKLVWSASVFALTVLLTFLAFPPVDMGEAAYLLLVPAAWWAFQVPAFRLYAAVTLGANVLAWTALLAWLHNVTWIGMFLLGPLVGLIGGTWFLAAWWVIGRIRGQRVVVRVFALLGLAALWVLLEWARGWIFGGFPWLPLAASQWQRPAVLQIAAYGGAWAVSFILVFFNLGLAALVQRLFFEKEAGKRSPEFMVAMLVFVCATMPLLRELFGQERQKIARVALVQPYIDQGEKWDPERARAVLETLEELTLHASVSDNPDAILWPEAVVPWALHRDPNVQPWLETVARRAGAPLLLGTVFTRPELPEDKQWFNGAFVVDPRLGLQSAGYAKRKLVPFGEYIPLRPLLGWLEKFVPIGGEFQRGGEARPLPLRVPSGELPVGVLICYEDTFPALARESTLRGAEVLAVLTNNGWFGEGGAAYQHAAHSVLRAVENRRPLLRVGNGGWSGWIDEYGHIRATLTGPDGRVYFRGHETVEISRDRRWQGRASFYVQHGDWFVIACVVVASLGYYLVRTVRPPRPEPEQPQRRSRFRIR